LSSLQKIYSNIIYDSDEELFKFKRSGAKKLKIAEKVDERDQRIKKDLKK